MTNPANDLEEQADALLREHGGFNKKTGVYTERMLRRKIRTREMSIEDACLQGLPVQASGSEAKRIIFDSAWPEIAKHLPWRESFVIECIRKGMTQDEMADAACVCTRTIRAWRTSAIRKLRASAHPYWPPWVIEVLIEVFSAGQLHRSGRI